MSIIGHQKIIKLLDRSIAKNTSSQAYLFCGPAHVGKFAVALEFARKLNGERTGADLDVIILAPETEETKGVVKEKDIKIESIRELQRKLSVTAYHGKYRIAIIDEAQKLTVSAQNSLLKILEESPSKCVLILIVQDEKKILPTVKSRCRIMKFPLVSDEEIEKNLLSDAKKRKEILFWSLGRPGLANRLLGNSDLLEEREAASQELHNLLSGSVWENFDLAEKMSKDSVRLLERMNFWVVVLREIIISRKESSHIAPEKALKLVEAVENTAQIIRETNVNSRLALENLFLKFI
jgi:DNA polymerase III subunit delta'